MLTLVVASLFLVSFGMVSHNAFADSVVATIPFGNQLTFGVGANPNTNKIYVASPFYSIPNPSYETPNDKVFVINGSTDTILGSVTVGTGHTSDVGVNPNTNKIYVTSWNCCSGAVTVINGTTDKVIGTVPSVGDPFGIAVNPSTNMVYVGDTISHNLYVINGTTDTVVNAIALGGEPTSVAVNPSTNKVYVTLRANDTVSIIDGSANSIVGTVSVGSDPFGITVNPSTNKVYVANYGRCSEVYCPSPSDIGTTVSVIDGSTNAVTKTIQVGSGPYGVAANPSTNKIYVTNDFGNTVSVIDGLTDSVESTLSVGVEPDGVGVNPSTNRIYVSNYRDCSSNPCQSSVTVIEGNSGPATVSQLQVNSQGSYGNTITGLYTKLYAQNGTQLDAGKTPYIFTLGNGQTYTVHVGNSIKYKFNHWLDTSSTDANRTISITSDQSITAVYATIPTHPSNLTATAVSPSEIDLRWNAPSSDGGSPITGYRIQSSTDGTTWTTIVKNTGNTSTTHSDTGLSPSTTYYYRVFALNSVGSSYRSNIASATTPLLSITGGSIALGNVQSTSGTTSSSNQMTLSGFNAGTGSNQLLLVGVSANNNNVTSVTFGGVLLSRAAYSFYNNDAEFWYLTNPTGSGDITVTMNGPTQAVVGAYSFSGVNQTLPIPTHVVKHNVNPNSPNISLTTKYANDWVLDLPSIYGGSTLSSPTCTQQWDVNVPNQITGASSSMLVPTPGTVTCSWTASSGDLYDDAAVEINAVR